MSVGYASVLTLSVVGNTFLLYVIYKIPSLRTTMNVFIGSHSAANLLSNIFCHPVELFQLYIGQTWVNGRAGWICCALTRYFRGACYLLFVSNLVVISMKGFYEVAKKASKNNRLLMTLTWSVPLALTIPIAFKAQIQKNGDHFVCTMKSQHRDEILVSSIVFGFIFGFLLPLVIMVSLLVKTWYKLWHPQETNVYSKKNHLQKRRVTIVTTAMVTSFVGCRLPLVTYFLHEITTGNGVYKEDEKEKISRFLDFLFCCTTALTPLLTIVFNPTMRKTGKSLFARYSPHKLPRVHRITVQSKNVMTVASVSN